MHLFYARNGYNGASFFRSYSNYLNSRNAIAASSAAASPGDSASAAAASSDGDD